MKLNNLIQMITIRHTRNSLVSVLGTTSKTHVLILRWAEMEASLESLSP